MQPGVPIGGGLTVETEQEVEKVEEEQDAAGSNSLDFVSTFVKLRIDRIGLGQLHGSRRYSGRNLAWISGGFNCRYVY